MCDCDGLLLLLFVDSMPLRLLFPRIVVVGGNVKLQYLGNAASLDDKSNGSDRHRNTVVQRNLYCEEDEFKLAKDQNPIETSRK